MGDDSECSGLNGGTDYASSQDYDSTLTQVSTGW